jgi:hypothetical protein
MCGCRWLEAHTNCPICRKDLDASDDQPSSSNRDSSQRQPGQQQQPGQQPDGDSCARGPEVRQEDLLRQVGAPGHCCNTMAHSLTCGGTVVTLSC